MNLIDIIKINWTLFFSFFFFISIIYLIFIKKYKFLLLFISSYLCLLFISFFFYILDPNLKLEDKRSFIINNNAEVLFMSPNSFLNSKDGRGGDKRLEYPLDRDKIKFPLASAPYKKIIACEEDEGPIIRFTDRFGLYNDDFLWDFQKHQITIIGDSHANSDCVNYTLHQILNENPQKKTVTLGQGGNGPLITYAITKEYLEKYKTNYIYYILATNDYSRENFSVLDIDLTREVTNDILLKTLNTDYIQGYFQKDNLEILQKKLVSISNSLVLNYSKEKNNILKKKIIDFFNLRFLIRTSYNLMMPHMKPGIRYLNNYEEKIFSKVLRNLFILNDGKIIFVVRPNINCVIRDNSEYDYIQNFLIKSNIPKNNILNIVDELCKKHLWSKKGNHLNAKGYKIMADKILQDYRNRN